MPEHEFPVPVGSGQGSRIAIHAEDRGGDLGTRVTHEKAPGRFSLRALGRDLPQARDRWHIALPRRRRKALRYKRIAVGAAAVASFEHAVFQSRFNFRSVIIPVEYQSTFLGQPTRPTALLPSVDSPASSPL